MGSSHAWTLFVESLNAPHTDRRYADDFNLASLKALPPHERLEAEIALLERLTASPEDDRVFSALEIVGSAASVKPLRAAAARGRGRGRVRAAIALRALDPEYDAIPVLVESLHDGNSGARNAAALALASAPAQAAAPALLEALTDPYFATRVCVFGALCTVLGLDAYRGHEHGVLKSIGMRLLSDLPSVFTDAAGDMRAVAGALLPEGDVSICGLEEPTMAAPEAVERVMTSLRATGADSGWKRDLDLEAIDMLDAPGRRYVEAVLLAELHGGDVRLARALAKVGGLAATRALREAIAASKEPLKSELAAALRECERATGATRG